MTNKKKTSTPPGAVGAYMNQIAKIILISVVTLVMASAAFGSDVTGDPEADGWVFGGNSLTLGTFVNGTSSGGVCAQFDFDIYTHAFMLASGSNLEGADWEPGDLILGMGGVITQDALNPHLTHSVRIVSKFGTSPTAWKASDTLPTFDGSDCGGTGHQGSHSGGHGGDGALLLATFSPAANNGLHLNPSPSSPLAQSVFVGPGEPGPGNVFEIPLFLRYDQATHSTSSVDSRFGKFIFLFDDEDFLSSWQVLLNVTALSEYLGSGVVVPGIGDRGIQTLQRSNSAFTDGLVTVAPAPPELTCVGFKPPLDKDVVVRRPNRVLPLRMTLEDADGFEVFDITPPVVSIAYSGNYLYAEGELDVLDSAGQSDDGNQFEFNFKGQFWSFNLSTKGLAPGTYTITAVSGNDGQYVIDPTCEVVVEIEVN